LFTVEEVGVAAPEEEEGVDISGDVGVDIY
jgi:hypothetical protein